MVITYMCLGTALLILMYSRVSTNDVATVADMCKSDLDWPESDKHVENKLKDFHRGL